jgi:uncharacterized protein (TIGR03000 family)
MRKITLCALMAALLIPQMASAQIFFGRGSDRGWRGDGWRGGDWGWRGSRGYYGGYYGDGFYGYYSSPNRWGVGFGSSYPYYGYYSYPRYSYYYPGYSYYSYDYPSYSYSYPSYSYPRTSSYYEPSMDSYDGQVMMTPTRARLEVIVPEPNAELFIQGQRMTMGGPVRTFISPDLEQGKEYTYTIKLIRNVSGRNEEDIRSVDVRAGSSTTIDFSRPNTQSMPAPGTRDQVGGRVETLPRSDATPPRDNPPRDNPPRNDIPR